MKFCFFYLNWIFIYFLKIQIKKLLIICEHKNFSSNWVKSSVHIIKWKGTIYWDIQWPISHQLFIKKNVLCLQKYRKSKFNEAISLFYRSFIITFVYVSEKGIVFTLLKGRYRFWVDLHVSRPKVCLFVTSRFPRTY